jgi:hypothetical protein
MLVGIPGEPTTASVAAGPTIPLELARTFAPDCRPFWTVDPGFINQVFVETTATVARS